MRRAVRYLQRLLLALIILAGLVAIAATVFIRTATFGRLLRATVNQFLAANYRGQIVIGAIDTTAFGGLALHDVTVSLAGHKLVRIPQAQLTYWLVPLLWHEVRLEVSVPRPVVNVQQDQAGNWDLLAAFAEKTPSTPSRLTVALDVIAVHDATITVAPRGPNGPHYRFERTNLAATLELPPVGIRFAARSLATRVVAPGVPPVNLTASLAYADIGSPTIAVKSLTLATTRSTLSMTARLKLDQVPEVTAQIDADRLAAADLAQVVPGFPLRDDLKGRVALQGPFSAVKIISEWQAGPASLNLDALADLTGATPGYQGQLTLASLDLGRLVAPITLRGTLDATVNAHGDGRQLKLLAAEAKVTGRNLSAGPLRAETVEFNTNVRQGRAQFAGKIVNGGSRIAYQGATELSPNPRYQLALTAQHLDLARLAGTFAGWPSDLNFKLALDGRGLDPAEIAARARLNLTASRVGPIRIDRGDIDARAHSGQLELTGLNLAAEGATAKLSGVIGLFANRPTQFNYALQVPRLTPWLALGRLNGDGRAELKGSVAGTLAGAQARGLHVRGTLAIAQLRVETLRTAQLEAHYDVAGLAHAGSPRGNAAIALQDVDASTIKLRTADAEITLERSQPPGARLMIATTDLAGRRSEARAAMTYARGRLGGTLEQLDLNLAQGDWRLAEPASFVHSARANELHNFVVQNGRQRLTVDAALSTSGSQHLALLAQNLPLDLIAPLLPPGWQATGTVSAAINVAGSAAAPTADAELQAKQLTFNRQRLGDLAATARYAAEAATVDATLTEDPAHQISARGTLPLSLSWAQGFRARIGTDMDLRVVTAGLRVAPLAGLAPTTIRNAGGLFASDLQLTGSPFRPNLSGSLRLSDGRVEILPLGVKVTEIFFAAQVTSDLLRVTQLTAKAGKGRLDGDGTIALANWAPGVLDARLIFTKWPAIATARYQATIAGTLQASGTPAAPRISGRLRVLDAVIHPDLALLNQSALTPDETITVIRPGAATPPVESTTGARATPSGPPPSVYNDLAADVSVQIQRDTWIRHEKASAELQGHLRITKEPQHALAITGVIETVRGWIVFQERQFTLVAGRITFTGGARIDPALDLDAQYTVPNYVIDVLVGGTAGKPTLNLRSQPALAQADILSLILFGKTTSNLGQSQSNSLQQDAAMMAAGAAASTIGQALARTLGLESMGFDVETAGGNLGLGRYIGKNTYVSASQDFTGTAGQKVSVQYFFLRWLSLTTSTYANGAREIFLNANRQY